MATGPDYMQDDQTGEMRPSWFCLPPRDRQTLQDEGLACMAIGITHPDRRDMGAYIRRILAGGDDGDNAVPGVLAGYKGYEFLTLDQVMYTILSLGPTLRPQRSTPETAYLPLVEPRNRL